MTAADRREELEAIVWRTRAVDQHAVRGILAAADRYAEAVADDRIDRASAKLDAVLGPQRLARAVEEVIRGTA